MDKPYLNINIQGEGPDLVLLHGWGMNNAVFDELQYSLSNYRIHNVDLPGFGDSQAIKGSIHHWVKAIANAIPSQSIVLGWSLGGLVAMQMAIDYPEKINAIITTNSSPCFLARENEQWPGIPIKVLHQFSEQLIDDLQKTVERFLAIQAMGSESAKQDIKHLKTLVLAKPIPTHDVLEQGLQFLKTIDLRQQLTQITVPWLRCWGRLDGLVPNKVIPLLPQSALWNDIIFDKASHAPFISHKSEFFHSINTWLEKLS